MNTKSPNYEFKKRSATNPKARGAKARKPAHLRGFLAPGGGQHCPPHCPPQPGPFLRQPAPLVAPLRAGLGPPLDIRAVAELIGCSPWTVRQTLIPRGLPYFRFKASGRLTFYQDQVIRWIENQQQGG